MKTRALALLGALALAACNNPAPTTGASGSPSAKPSTSTAATATPKATDAPAATGASTVKLTLLGETIALDGDVTFTPTDLVGKRLRLSATIGEATAEGKGQVSFLFGAGGADMVPGWDVKNSGAVFSVGANVWAKGKPRAYEYSFTTNTTKLTTDERSAEDGHIRGKLEGEAFPQTGSAEANTREPFTLEFDLVQPAKR